MFLVSKKKILEKNNIFLIIDVKAFPSNIGNLEEIGSDLDNGDVASFEKGM
mgnify:CR=1 FL=1